MKKLLFCGMVVALLLPASAMAQSAFDGTWKVDLNKAQASKKPFVITLKDGMYHCTCDTPPINIKANGQDYAVSGHPGYDMVAIKVLNDHSVQETDKKDGKVVTSSTFTAAADGKTATNEFTDSSGTTPVTGKVTFERVAKAADATNAVAGSWRVKAVNNISDNGLTFTLKVDGDTLSMTDPTGGSYTAKMDGSDAQTKGLPDVTSVTVKKTGKNSLQITGKRDGKVITVRDLKVAADGKTMKITRHDKLQGTTMSAVADKQ
ncbi:MAG: hypothetical protein ABI132_12080 [Rhodanobacteraceae bacterium]